MCDLSGNRQGGWVYVQLRVQRTDESVFFSTKLESVFLWGVEAGYLIRRWLLMLMHRHLRCHETRFLLSLIPVRPEHSAYMNWPIRGGTTAIGRATPCFTLAIPLALAVCFVSSSIAGSGGAWNKELHYGRRI